MKKSIKKVLLLFIISTISSPSHGMERVQTLYEKIRNNFCFALGVTQKGKQFAINHPFVTAGTICLGATTTAYLAYKWFFNKPKNGPSTIIQTNSHPEQTTTNLNKLPKTTKDDSAEKQLSTIPKKLNFINTNHPISHNTNIINSPIAFFSIANLNKLQKTSPVKNNAVIKINNNLNQFNAIENQPNVIEIDTIINKTEIIHLHELTRNINGEFYVFRITNKSASILQNLNPNYFPKNQEGLHTVMNATTKEIFFASQKTDQGYICLVNKNINKNGNALGWETGDEINPLALLIPKNTPQVTVIPSLKTNSENSMQQLFRKIIDATTNILFTPKKCDAINPLALPMPENTPQVTIAPSPEINTKKLLTPEKNDQKYICPINENINKNGNTLGLKKDYAINPAALPMPKNTPQVTIAPSPEINTKKLFTPEKNNQKYICPINENINKNGNVLRWKTGDAIKLPALPMSKKTHQVPVTPSPKINTENLMQQCKLPYNGTVGLNRITTITLEQLKSILSNNAMGSEKPKHKKEKKKTKNRSKITGDTESNQEQESTKNLDQAQIIDDVIDNSVTSTITPATINTDQQNKTDTDNATELTIINQEQIINDSSVIQCPTPEQQSTSNLNQNQTIKDTGIDFVASTKKALDPIRNILAFTLNWTSTTITDTDRRHEKAKEELRDAQIQRDIHIHAENLATTYELGMW